MVTSFPATYSESRPRRNVFPALAGLLLLVVTFPASGEPLIRGAEREADRGRGRVIDRPTYQLERIERSTQSPPPREIDVITEETERRRLIERQERREGPSLLEQRLQEPLPPAETDPARIELVSLILAAVERRDLQLSQARRELPPDDLPAREAEINERFSQDLNTLLDRWRRGGTPATQPAD